MRSNRVLSIVVSLSLVCCYAASASAQSSDASHKFKSIAQLDRVTLDRIDVDAVLAEDVKREADGFPPRFAIKHPSMITPDTHGDWETFSSGGLMWRMVIKADGAYSINLGFTRYHMPVGGSLFIASSDYSYTIRPFTEQDNKSHGQLWTPPVLSDEIVLEVTLPDAEAAEELELELTSINYGYRGIGQPLSSVRPRSDNCHVDVACSDADDWQDEVKSVAWQSYDGMSFCTGFMINNTANDLTPYYMTARHCGVTGGNAASLVVVWNYQNSTCRTPGSVESGAPGDGTFDQFNSGATWLASYGPSDFTLVELDTMPEPDWEVHWAGWDRTGVNPTIAVGIHHPNGDEKRISFDQDPLQTTSEGGFTEPGSGTHLRVVWDLGVTEPGSSGSPLFDQNHRVVGQLESGESACGFPGGSDWYGKFSVSWDGNGTPQGRLSDWLDPGNTGAETVDTIEEAVNDFKEPFLVSESPERGSVLGNLSSIVLMFDEKVEPFTADALTVNGSPATEVDGNGKGPYEFFGFDQPGDGEAVVELAGGVIQDQFGNANGGETWTLEIVDCNGNLFRDDEDIASGFSRDCNGNGVPDDCEDDLLAVVEGEEMAIATGDVVTLYGPSLAYAGTPPYNFTWRLRGNNGAEEATDASPSYSPAQPGVYVVQFTVADAVGCSADGFVTITAEGEAPGATEGEVADPVPAGDECGNMLGVPAGMTLAALIAGVATTRTRRRRRR